MSNYKQWKVNLLNYAWIEQQEGSACYCLSNKSAQMLLTISQMLAWATRWEGNEFFTDEQREQIFQWANDCEAELMNGCCGNTGQTIRIRVNNDVRVEVSTDGGVTWSQDDNYDPRSTGTVYAPITGGTIDENACMAAANVIANLQELINDDFVGILTSVIGLAGISASLAPIVAAWMGVPVAGQGVATAVFIAGLVGAGAAEGAAAITDAFDTEFYDWFLCEYYCSVGNGEVTWTDVDNLIAAINEEYPDGGDDLTLRVVGFGVLKALGPVGLTNMARLGASAGDCSLCDCSEPTWCYEWDFTVAQGTDWINPHEGTYGVWVSGQGWRASQNGASEQVLITLEFPEVTTITELTITVEYASTIRNLSAGFSSVDPLIDLNPDNGTSSPQWLGETSGEGMFIALSCAVAEYGGIEKVLIRGLGTNPFGSDNCEA